METIEPFAFEQIYGAWWKANVLADAKAAVVRSAERYLSWISVGALSVATGSPQDESVQCADLWPVAVGRAGSALPAALDLQNRRARSDAPYLRRPTRLCKCYRAPSRAVSTTCSIKNLLAHRQYVAKRSQPARALTALRIVTAAFPQDSLQSVRRHRGCRGAPNR